MARLALTVAGGIIGGLLALPTGGVSVGLGISLGLAAGGIAGTIEGMIFPGGQNVVGPRLTDLNVSSSTDGSPIPDGRGIFRIAGEIIWAQEIQEHKHTEKVSSKGGPTSTTFTYTASFAVAFCKGEANILQLWGDSKVIYDITGKTPVAATDAFRPTFYRGDETQNPDPLIVSIEGADATPGFRGLCYAVFEDFPLTNFGNRIPNFRATVSAGDVAPAFPMTLIPWTFPTAGNYPSGILIDYLNQLAYVGGANTDTLTKFRLGDNALLQVNTPVNPTTVPGYVDPEDGHPPFEYVSAPAFNQTLAAGVDDKGFLWGSAYANSTYSIFKLDPASMQAVKVFNLDTAITTPTLAQDLNVWLPADGGPAYIVSFHFDSSAAVLLAVRSSDGAAMGKYVVTLGAHAITDLTWTQFLPVFDGKGNAFIIASYEIGGALDFYVWKINMLGENTGTEGNQFTDADIFSFTGDGTTGVGRWMVYDSKSDKILIYTSTGTILAVDPADGSILQTENDFFDVAGSFTPGMCVHVVNGQARNGVFFVGRGTELAMIQASSLSAQGIYALPDDWGGSDLTGVTINDLKFSPLDVSVIMTVGVNYPSAGSTTVIFRLYLDRQSGNGFSLGTYAGELMEAAGVASGDIDTTAIDGIDCLGYVITNPQDVKTSLAPLAQFGFFDLVESDFKIKAVVRGGSAVLTVPEDDLGLVEDQQKVGETIGQEEDLARTSTVTYIDPDLDYQQGKQMKIRNTRTTGSQAQIVMSSPLVLSKMQALQMAEKYLWLTDAERTKYAFNLWRASYILLDPTDVINFILQGLEFQARLQTSSIGKNYAVEIAGVSENAKKYLADGTGVGKTFNKATVQAFGPTLLFIFDVPLLADSDSQSGNSGYYWAMASPVGNWPGGVLYSSSDNADFGEIDFSNTAIAYGGCVAALGAPRSSWTWDTVNTLTVFMAKGTPASVTKAAVLNGANGVLVDSEVIQFQTATQNADESWTLSNLLRGRRGTDWACASHQTGETAYFLNLQGGLHRQAQGTAVIGLLRYLKAVTVGSDLNSQGSQQFTLAGNDLKPYAPSHLTGALSSSDFVITWVRRTRLGGEVDWHDGVTDVPLSEQSELYDLEILDSMGAVVRTVTGLTSPTYTYLAADQTTDFGGDQTTISVRVYQVSATVGRGFAAVNTSIGS